MDRAIPESITAATPWWPEAARSDGPNVVLVVLDDTGFADLGCYGSDIATPTLDRLARNGVLFNNFHVTPLCSPTRAALLTGRNHHTVGMRFLASVDTGQPNCRGRITHQAGTIPELLRGGGYATMGTGKWHLVPVWNSGAAGPFDDWPLARGFDRFYGFLGGVVDQWHPELVQDNHTIEPPESDGYHVSADIVDQSIHYLKDHLSLRPDDPFFLYVAFGATHAPHQVPIDYIERYVEPSGKGWDQTRIDRLRRQVELGVVPPGTELAPRNEGVRPWAELSDDEQKLAARLQAAYAGFVEHTDEQIGRLVTFLSESGVLDTTLILVMSDNGASMEGGDLGAVHVHTSYATRPQSVTEQLEQLDLLGGPASSSHYAAGWAMASNTPFRRYKRYVDGGGVNAPLIAHWPAGIVDKGAVRSEFVHVIDIMPTLLEVAKIDAPTTLNGIKQLPITGESIAGMLSGARREHVRESQYFEMFGQRAIWVDGWKAIAWHDRGTPYDTDPWHLYHLDTDFSEVHDLATTRPDKLAELKALWERDARLHGVFPLDDRGMNELLHSGPNNATRVFDLRPGQSYLTSGLIPTSMSFRVGGRVTLEPSTSGALIARGGESGGFTIFALDGTIVFEINELGQPHRIVTPERHRGSVEFEAVLNRLGNGAEMTLTVGDWQSSRTIDRYFGSSFIGLQVGKNTGSPVSPLYRDRLPFEYPPQWIERLQLEYFEPGIPPTLHELDQLPPQ